jgi:hypothetical protein
LPLSPASRFCSNDYSWKIRDVAAARIKLASVAQSVKLGVQSPQFQKFHTSIKEDGAGSGQD